MTVRRITLFGGHYGSGKTNIAVNYALYLKRQGFDTAVCDLDIVNPYFRTKDSKAELDQAGISLIAPRFANSNVDLPALPQELYGAVQNRSLHAVLDVGGDDRGALALGRYAPYILEENDYDMLFVANFYRPLTPDADHALEVLREVENAGGIPFTGIVNNSNLASETTPEDVLRTLPEAEKLSRMTGLEIRMTCAERRLAPELEGKVKDFFPLTLQKKYFDIRTETKPEKEDSSCRRSRF